VREEYGLKMYENRVLRRIFGPKRDEVAGDWRRLQNEELSNWYPSQSIVGVIRSRRMRWAERVACMEKASIFWVEDLGIDERILE
jgi:hypothetical protein